MTIKRCLAALGATIALFLLAIFGTVKQDIADPITTSSIPQPDWLFLVFFQVTRYCQDAMEMVGVFWIPLAVILGLLLLPCLDKGGERTRGLKWLFFSGGLLLFVALSVFTFRSGSTTPVNSCAACHKEGFGEAFATPPSLVEDFSTRYDNRWLALHYRYPQYFWMMDATVPKW